MKNLYKYYVLFLSFQNEKGDIAETPQYVFSYAFYAYDKTCSKAYQHKKFHSEIAELEEIHRKEIFAVVVPTEIVIENGTTTAKRKSMEEAYKGMPSYSQAMTEKYYLPILENLIKNITKP